MAKSPAIKERIWELDFFRGLALLLMIYFHMVFDLKELYNINISIYSGINFFIGRSSAILFIFISGISCMLSRSNVKRGVKVLLCAICITLATYIATNIFSSDLTILFGILHFFGISMIIAPFFKHFNKYVLLAAGTIILLAGNFYIPHIHTSNNYLFPIGITDGKFTSADYYPLLPWFGIFLYGIAAGKILYKNKRSILKLKPEFKVIGFWGRHSLLVYMVHQPLILAILAVMSYFSFFK